MRPTPVRFEFNPLHPLAEGLAAAWHPARFPGGGMLRDSIWGINGMTASASPPVSIDDPVMGLVRQYVAASAQYFNAADNANLSTGDIDFTVVTWVRFTTLAADQRVVNKWELEGGTNQREFLLQFGVTANRLQWFVSSNGTFAAAVSVSADALGVPATGIWYCVIGWHDSVNNQIGIEANGLSNTANHTLGVFDSTAEFCLGGKVGATSRSPLNGYLGPVYYYKRMLSSQERLMHYLDPHAPFRPAGLRAGMPIVTKGIGRGGSKYGLQTLVPGFSY